MRRVLVVSTVLLVAIILVVRAWAAPAPARSFEGYWMGVDPVDGGDQRRSFFLQENGTLAGIGRDSFLRLCDESDRGLITFDDGNAVGKRSVATDNFTL